jgi:hypothetical protein
MYAFAPVALAGLMRRDPDRPRSYRMPAPTVLLPTAFCSANLILYWGGYDVTWKLAIALVIGLVLFTIGARVARTDAFATLRNAAWIGPWIIGTVVLGALGRYGVGAHNILPEWIDLLAVVGFSLAIFYWAAHLTMGREQVQEAIARDSTQLESAAAAG